MKLTESQIKLICRYTDAYRIDREKLASYLEKHRTIKSEIFGYCSKVSRKGIGARGYCMYLDDEPMYTPVDRETFIRRIPFYFYQMPMGGDSRSGLSLIIPVQKKNSKNTEDYETFYSDLEWMLYDLGIPVAVICDYIRDQIAPEPAPQKDNPSGRFNIRLPSSIFHEGGLHGRSLFRQWRHYLHLCVENGWTDYTPSRFITAYNEALIRVGQKPVIYYPVKDYGTIFVKENDEMICNGHFPCDQNGAPIMEWTAIRVKHPEGISYKSAKSQCGELRIKLGPKTLLYALNDEVNDDEEEDPYWEQVYAGPQTMEFDNEMLREFRLEKKMTQSKVAAAIGTSVRTYQKWESGETTPDGHFLLRLMNWLDIDNVQSLVKYIDFPDET